MINGIKKTLVVGTIAMALEKIVACQELFERLLPLLDPVGLVTFVDESMSIAATDRAVVGLVNLLDKNGTQPVAF